MLLTTLAELVGTYICNMAQKVVQGDTHQSWWVPMAHQNTQQLSHTSSP